MASRSNAKLNNLNDRAREVGRGFEQLTLNDLEALRNFYDFTCLHCGVKPAISPDHVKPLKLGGENTVENLQLLCDNCNKAKGDKEEDYRQGKVLTRELADAWIAENKQSPQTNPTKQTYKKHDWEQMEYEYIYEGKSTSELARLHKVSHSNVEAVCSRRRWVEKRNKIRGELGETIAQDAQRIAIELAHQKNLDALTETMNVLSTAISMWEERGSEANFRDIIEGLKNLGAMQGQTTGRTVIVNEADDYADTDIIEAASRIARRADRQASERDISRSAPDEDGFGAGWSD